MNEILTELHFLRPGWLLAILPAAAICALLWRARAEEGNWARAVAPELLVHLLDGDQRSTRRLGVPGLFLAWLIACLAAAGPAWQQLPRPVLQKQDALVIVIDLSYSLMATDLAPSRHEFVRRKLLDLLRRRDEGLTAMVAYAGDAHIVAPLTDDTATIANLLPALSPDMMPLPGSNPVDGVEQALGLLKSAGVQRGRVLLVTDGITADDRQTIADALRPLAHRLAILGVGSDIGAPIPLPDGGFVKDALGNIVIPTFEALPLRGLASDTNGAFRRVSVDDSDLQYLLSATEMALDDTTVSLDRRADQWQDMGHWLAILLLPVALVMFRRGWIYGLAFLALQPTSQVEAAGWRDLWLREDQQALRALRDGDAAGAAARFADPDWRGTASFEAGDYEASGEAFSQKATADAWYNRGNAFAAQGRFDEALAAWRETLERDPQARDAAKNIETIERLLDEQQSQQSQNSQQQSGQQGGQQEQEQNQQQNQSGQDQGEAQDSEQQSGSNSSDAQQGSESDPQYGENADQRDQQDQQQGQPQDGASEEQSEESASDAGSGSEGREKRREREPLRPEIDNSAMQESLERDQAVEQWLRRVPDDPSGLLREKFRYETRQRQKNGEDRRNGQIW